MRDLYAENYKTFVKLIDDDSKKWNKREVRYGTYDLTI